MSSFMSMGSAMTGAGSTSGFGVEGRGAIVTGSRRRNRRGNGKMQNEQIEVAEEGSFGPVDWMSGLVNDLECSGSDQTLGATLGATWLSQLRHKLHSD
ncbi:unnamed protein product [Phytophthora fragariaefolia]|uniref:Unnamed protein product n=1 Tax=Phytophthora fragariaefolia TaxID=1490495 RepID=A0A9W6YGT1_9STRA|nr:unnamed protein product [Phytophthora fragariaefolia]